MENESEVYADQDSESEHESDEECSESDSSEGGRNSGDEGEREQDEADDADFCASSLWTKSVAFNPSVPACPYEATTFDLWDFEPQSTPLDAFKHFVDADIMEEILMQTNLYASQGGEAFKNWKEVTISELWIFLGLHFLMGIIKKPSYKDYFSVNPLICTPIFGEHISRDRFFGILRALHFSNNECEGAKSHRLNKLGKLLPSICENFKNAIQPGEFLCVDESLLLFKGRLSFLQYIPSKRARFGIKFYCLVDCETKFLIGIIPYTGKSTRIDRDVAEDLGFGGATVVTLIEAYLGKNRKIILDNFFTSPKLLDYLLKRQTYVLGTVRHNRKQMPVSIKTEKLKKGEVTVYCTGDKVVERWKDRRDVYMINNFLKHEMKAAPSRKSFVSSNNDPPTKKKKVDDSGLPKLKPSTVLLYNSTMGGVDDVDRQIVHYVAERKTLKWYKKVAFHIFDLCIYNAFILYKHHRNIKKMEYKKFLFELITEILKEFKLTRSRVGRPVHYEDPSALRLNGKHHPVRIRNSNGDLCRQRCKFCFAKTIRHDTSYCCATCQIPLCITVRSKKSCFDLYHTVACLPSKAK